MALVLAERRQRKSRTKWINRFLFCDRNGIGRIGNTGRTIHPEYYFSKSITNYRLGQHRRTGETPGRDNHFV